MQSAYTYWWRELISNNLALELRILARATTDHTVTRINIMWRRSYCEMATHQLDHRLFGHSSSVMELRKRGGHRQNVPEAVMRTKLSQGTLTPASSKHQPWPTQLLLPSARPRFCHQPASFQRFVSTTYLYRGSSPPIASYQSPLRVNLLLRLW